MAKKLVDKVLGLMGFEEEPLEEEERERFREEDSVPQVKRKGQVFSLHTQRQVRVIVAEPRAFEDVQSIAEHLKNRRPVVVNLERAESELARRVVDFVSGATYALNGSMQKVGNGIFLFVPSNMDIAGDIKEYGERGIFPWMGE
ncbi:cell division protein SepF [Desulfofundulus thermosubterraneus]|uniref:Cell division protein SepF n=1 Tax=Desulfofundulus thermosubterraneus DSM 16057 TaxID=1121432 RepID=A0A1M6CFT1_9FIRM|nr:cell division protein SepF [Desulfofundulus thermosubterraneus]SHI59879.1 cell division inhibitor SepF [Desulfofundulus thermosubterraneus DSM 16057]